MHDHSKREKRFCPLMKEWCIKGWTPAMGMNADGFPIEGACASWQPVTLFDPKKNLNEEIHDCAIFGWTPDLLASAANEVQRGAAATDKVATQILKHRREFIGALPEEAKGRIVSGNIDLLEAPRENNGQHPKENAVG